MTKPRSVWKIVVTLGLACAACCAPLILPWFVGVGGAGLTGALVGGMLGASWAEIAFIAVLAALATGATLLLRTAARRKRAPPCACNSPIGNGLGCSVGADCNPAQRSR